MIAKSEVECAGSTEITKIFAQLGMQITDKEISKVLGWSRFIMKRFRDGEKEMSIGEFKKLMASKDLDIMIVKRGTKVVEIKEGGAKL